MMDLINTEVLLEAYSFGVFPWPHAELPILWYSPEERGVLDFSKLHIPKSLNKFIKQSQWTITFNKSFDQVLEECALAPRPGQDGTWITKPMLDAYKQFHKDGYAHSVECWDGYELIGGMYGVDVAGVFSGESMFFKKSNASKVCLISMIELLKANGRTWMDIQMVTHNLEVFGGAYIARTTFFERLEASKKNAKALTFPN